MQTEIRYIEYYASSGPEALCRLPDGSTVEIYMPEPNGHLNIFTVDHEGDYTEIRMNKEDLGEYIQLLQQFHSQL